MAPSWIVILNVFLRSLNEQGARKRGLRARKMRKEKGKEG
jgi:hypothetical protein